MGSEYGCLWVIRVCHFAEGTRSWETIHILKETQWLLMCARVKHTISHEYAYNYVQYTHTVHKHCTYYNIILYNVVGCSPTSSVHRTLTLLESLQMSMHVHTEDKLGKRLS